MVDMTTMTCKICQKEFDSKTKRGPYKTLCSIECKKVYVSKYHSHYYEKNREEINKKHKEYNNKRQKEYTKTHRKKSKY